MDDAALESLDVLIVGAGISGISAACHLQRLCPGQRFAIIEARADLGGTWDLFRYPGVRSDSDMHTLGFAFRPWSGREAIAGGAAILAYLRETAHEHGLAHHLRFGQRVVRADWSSADARWLVQLQREADGTNFSLHCRFLFMCSGYYDYAAGYQPDFPGLATFAGRVVHPQHWPADLDCAGQRVLVIGSGATAVTLVPALAASAAQVTMLQRSPTWLVARPALDALEQRLRKLLPQALALGLVRWKNVLLGWYVFRLCRRHPQRMRTLLLAGVRRALGPGADIARNYTPRYNPWQQRLCLVPDGDFFKAVKSGRAAVVTEHIESFTESGVRLRSGAALEADIVVCATGLKLSLLGQVALFVDGRELDAAKCVSYKGALLSGVPNLAHTFGYTNASWTLKADLTARYVCRLLNHMQRRGARICVPPPAGAGMATEPWVDFSSGYFQRAAAMLPRQGVLRPWKLSQNYLRDVLTLRWGRLDDGVLQFLR